jgi:two-component system chemotaxis response regulator CheY
MVLTDLNMPYMDGLEFIRHMKREVAYRQIPALMITTEADEEEKQKAFDAGADGYLIKPVSAEDVNCKVRELLKRIFKTGGDLRV